MRNIFDLLTKEDEVVIIEFPSKKNFGRSLQRKKFLGIIPFITLRIYGNEIENPWVKERAYSPLNRNYYNLSQQLNPATN